MQTGVIHDFHKWCNMVPSASSIHGAYWYKCFSKLRLALFIWKDQKQQLELPEAKASIWPGIVPVCHSIDHGTLCHLPLTGQPLSALYGMDAGLCSCLLKAGFLFHSLWLLSLPPSCTWELATWAHHFSLEGAVPIPPQALFFLFQTFCTSRDLPISSRVSRDG